MKIIINDQQPVSLIREQFNRLFPYLRIEFFSCLHAPGQTGSNRKEPWNKKLGELREKSNTGEIDVLPGMTVQELEQLFGEKYGIGVQVLRRFGKTWLETGRTDNITLNHLNSLGKKDSLLAEN